MAKNKINISIIILIFLFCNPAYTQTITQPEGIKKTLTAAEFIEIIKKYHPVVNNSLLSIKQARAALVQSRGGFDPYLKSNYETKNFSGTNYYNYFNAEIKIPTWYGIEVKGGVEELTGARANPESTLGQTSYLGISVPLAKNLLMDRRRTMLKQARINVSLSEQENILAVNDVLHDALKSYWEWAYSYKSLVLVKSIVDINNNRLRFIKSLQGQGEAAVIDTVEVQAQLYNFLLALNEAELKFINAELEVSNFLWLENNQPYTLPNNVVPDTLWDMANFENASQAILDTIQLFTTLGHPKIASYAYKLNSLDVERRYKIQNLLPEFTVSANLLSKGYANINAVDRLYLENNSKFSVNFSLPLRLSEARGERAAVEIKINQTQNELDFEKISINNKIVQATNNLLALKEQIRLSEVMLNGYRALYNAEDTRFKLGESSLFLVNTRENRYLDALKKLLELKAEYYKAEAKLYWATGRLPLYFYK